MNDVNKFVRFYFINNDRDPDNKDRILFTNTVSKLLRNEKEILDSEYQKNKKVEEHIVKKGKVVDIKHKNRNVQSKKNNVKKCVEKRQSSNHGHRSVYS